MPREKVGSGTRLPFEWTTEISQSHVMPVLRLCTTLTEARGFSSHAKLGENNLRLTPSFDFNIGKVEALGGLAAIDFIIATDMDSATVFADFDAGRLELRAKSQLVLQELLDYWKQQSEEGARRSATGKLGVS